MTWDLIHGTEQNTDTIEGASNIIFWQISVPTVACQCHSPVSVKSCDFHLHSF
jgi:hypothetical protein